MMADLELEQIDNDNTLLFMSEYQNLSFNNRITVYKNGNSTLLELLSTTSIAGFKNIVGRLSTSIRFHMLMLLNHPL